MRTITVDHYTILNPVNYKTFKSYIVNYNVSYIFFNRCIRLDKFGT